MEQSQLNNAPSKSPSSDYDVSFVMPCYNEADVVDKTVSELVAAFARSPHRLHLVTVDNGSSDGTGDLLKDLARRFDNVAVARVEQNQGYGFGVLNGLPLCIAPWVGIIVADGQVDPDDVVKLFGDATRLSEQKLVKVRRRFRMDGFKRKVVSVIYNVLTNVMFGGLGSIDINGSPKIIPREYLERMDLQSKDWFLDPEIMIKAKRLGLGVYEKNIFAQLRPGGSSNVNSLTCVEFIKNLFRYRFGRAGRLDSFHKPSERTEVSTIQSE